MRRRRYLSRYVTVCAVGATSLIGSAPSFAASAGISLNRTIAPPQAAKIGSGSEQITYTVTYDSRGTQVAVRILSPSGVPVDVPLQIRNLADPGPSVGRTVTDTVTWVVPNGISPGRYFAEVRFFSNGDLTTPEVAAQVAFDVAPQRGQFRLLSWEDLNGNGVRDSGEAGLSGWSYSVVNPYNGTSGLQTGSDGSLTASDVPAGTWQVAQTVESGWIAMTPSSGVMVVPTDGVGTYSVGNVRPGTVSGTIFIDVNGNGVLDSGETGTGGITVTLSGTDGLGRTVSAQKTSGLDGTYAFTGLLPGTYKVASSEVPGTTRTTPAAIDGIGLISAGIRTRNDFGLVNTAPRVPTSSGPPTTPPATVPQPAVTPPSTSNQRVAVLPARADPQTQLLVRKQGPVHFVPGQSFRYRITVRNTGKTSARNVVLTDPIPNLMTVVQPPAGARLDNGILTWDLGSIAPGAQKRVSFLVRLASGAPAGEYPNKAIADADNSRPTVGSTRGRLDKPAPKASRPRGVTG